MPLPRVVARLNKRYTNRFIEPIVRRTPGFAVIEHVGRRSGTTYHTPVYAFHGGGHRFVALTYGPTADWVQNVLAADAMIRTDDDSQTMTSPSIVGRSTAWAHLPRIVRVWLRILRVRDFLRFDIA